MSSSQSKPTKKYETLYCRCNLQCLVFTVRKESKNKGRDFYCCPRWKQPLDCMFFRWVEDVNCASDSCGRPEMKIEQGYAENLKEVLQLIHTVEEKIDYGLRQQHLMQQHLMLAALVVLFHLVICFTIVLFASIF